MKKFFFLVLSIAILVGGCAKQKAEKEKLNELTALMLNESLNKEVVMKYIDGLNKNDSSMYRQLFEAVYSPSCKIYMPAGNPNFVGFNEIVKAQKDVYTAIPDAHWEIVDIAADGNTVMARLWTTGTNTGAFNGIPPSGNKIGFSNTVTFKMENGKIVEQLEDYDQLSVLIPLGFELVPPKKMKK